MTYTMGSLFDGSGGFPLAATLCGITPKWAAEIEPYPIAVTRSRFPDMTHYGDVSKINGAEIEPVDVITFGSPCQDLSIAGKRAGLKHEANGDEETTRSGLFVEAVRIIKEMREATNGRYPNFALWENVPGAFSSNKGEDFRAVLDGLIKIVEPNAVMPQVPAAGWNYSDSYSGDGWSLAYRVFDAQYWGVPQRRRRIHLVLDLRGERAREVLFEREGLRGYFAQSGATRQGTAADAEGGSGADDREGADCIAPTAYAFDSLDSNAMKSKNPHSGCRAVEVSKTLDASDPNPCKNQGGMAVVEALPFDTTQVTSPQNGNNPKWGDPCHPLAAQGHPPTVICKGMHLFENHSQDTRYKGPLEVSPMLPAQLGTGGNNTPFVVAYSVGNGQMNQISMSETCNTLDCMHDRQKVLVGHGSTQYIVRRLTPTECARLQGFADRWGWIDEKDSLTAEEYQFWLDVRNTHAAINGKAVKEYTVEQMLKWYNKLHTDSAEYKMWGNGIALPPAIYCMQGIAYALEGVSDDWML